ncbi:interferon-induced GTP-binding protein mx2 [Grosmannia clavigera kw1407]|uniref:Interferon-induced GTP-binding protein mx2 n=1 Tax=Grosmannia clavigera (strain kw1407 / UAMH 11150) TaxID=655863 RepID=F0XBL9_GROCL|nr:interferon-induced GTP-binding protein mx2 [Grosmannia clavigera kw1407]EFX04945.1 interferon-induced GTP-binding protein mx2 [Grosmannia clavigera kw1407]
MEIPPNYCDDPRFSRTFVLPPNPANGRPNPFTVKYADYGYRNEAHPEEGIVLLVFGSMLASRLVHIPKDEVAKKHKVRVINPDRPGIGGTDAVAVDDMLPRWSETMAALLVHLGIKHVALSCHSGGTLFALDLLLRHPEILSPDRPYLAIGAPWIRPAHTTSTLMSVVQVLPGAVVGKLNKFARFFNQHLSPVLGAAVGASQAFVSTVTSAASSGSTSDAAGDMEREGARFEVDVWPTLLKRIYVEGIEGISSEALLFTRKSDGGAASGWSDWGDYDVLVPRLVTALRSAGRRLVVDVFYAETDYMIGDGGTKGPLWFDQCWDAEHRGDVVDYSSTVIKGADHDRIWDLRWGVAQQVFETIGQTGLGNEGILKKIDSLRAANVGTLIPLPQLIVVGDQSSGKSSVLESLTGFSFPRAPGLCTRYATQITCSREARKKVSISIIPRPHAEDSLKRRLQDFRRVLDGLENDHLTRVFEEANAAMGIRMSASDDSQTAFSEDILKIEISGPDQVHLTVIDVPGIFRLPTPGLTTEADVVLVRNIVKRYMEHSRTIILAVVPSNVDIATQEILRLAEEADPEGVRTMGVLTKPDLATERATQEAVVELVEGQRNRLKLGYYVVKNRSADDGSSDTAERLASEKAFFTAPPWSLVADRCGIPRLKARLRELLMEITRSELPQVKVEIRKLLQARRAQLKTMGEPRADASSQRQYLVHIATRMQNITSRALNGFYAGEALFTEKPGLRLITKVIKLNEAFADTFWREGHYQTFEEASGSKTPVSERNSQAEEADEEDFDEDNSRQDFLDIPGKVHEDLIDIVDTSYRCPKPLDGPMTPTIQKVYESNRGPELGTVSLPRLSLFHHLAKLTSQYNGTILAAVFEILSQKWEELALAHTSRVIILVHQYLHDLLGEVCPDREVRQQIWDGILRDELSERYRGAKAHAEALLDAERNTPPATFSRRYSELLQAKRQARLADKLSGLTTKSEEDERRYVSLDEVERQVRPMDMNEQVCEDVLDALGSYYTIARERFVDTLYQQVVYNLLLGGKRSPLKVLDADRVLDLSEEQLGMIAGEDALSRAERAIVEHEMQSLEEAMRVLRS